MSEAIKPLDPQALIDLFPPSRSAHELSRELELLEGDALYAPADVSETPVGPVPRRVQTLTNSPGCAPAAAASQAPAHAAGDATTDITDGATAGAREGAADAPIRRARAVRTDAWALPAPAHWGRARRAQASATRPGRAASAGVRRVEPDAARGRRGAPKASRPSADWSLPF